MPDRRAIGGDAGRQLRRALTRAQRRERPGEHSDNTN